mgnify:CR=1 FL=1
MRSTRACLLMASFGLSVGLPACGDDEPFGPDPGLTEPGVLVTGYGVLDAIAVVGEGEFLFAERTVAIRWFSAGTITEVTGTPPVRMSDVYGGLLDVSLHPGFEQNRWVYIAYVDGSFGLAVARFELRDDRAEGLEVIREWNEFSIGSRIEWQDADHFFLSFGVGGSPFPDPGPQDMSSAVGKIHRLTAMGEVPADNPLIGDATAPTTVWSYGHRNPQGLYFDASEVMLYANEHGPLGGDELNVVVAGGNYGWPLFSYGLNYDQTPVSDMTEAEAADFSVLPLKYWGPNFRVAPSGLIRIESSEFPAWSGSFLMGALNPQHLLRYDPDTDETEIVEAGVGRVRDVALQPSGRLFISVDSGSPSPAYRGLIVELPR